MIVVILLAARAELELGLHGGAVAVCGGVDHGGEAMMPKVSMMGTLTCQNGKPNRSSNNAPTSRF